MMIELGAHPRGRALVNMAQVTHILAGDGATRVHFRDGSALDVRHKLSEIQELLAQRPAA